MKWFDVFNGDADGLCALHQLRLAEPVDAELVTGPKRDTRLLERVNAGSGDRITVLDVSLDRNRAALTRLLDRGAQVRWFDHHFAGEIPAHARLETQIDVSPDTCTSAIVDRVLGGRHRAWAVVAAYGDGLAETARALAEPLGVSGAEQSTLQALGESLNYNAYGETEADLFVPPAALYRTLSGYADPLAFAAREPVVARLDERRRADLAAALAVGPFRAVGHVMVYVLPDEPWARRVSGTFAHHLAASEPARAHAVLVPLTGGGYGVSIRAPHAAPQGAAAFARSFGGGGREAAAGIDCLPAADLEAFGAAFARAF